MNLLNNFLHAHLECLDQGISLWQITDALADAPEFTDNFYHWPFMSSDNDAPLTPDQLARITYLCIDDAAWKLGTDFLQDLPNLRELYLQSYGCIPLEFLSTLPDLQVLYLQCEELEDQSPLWSLKNLTHLILDFDRPWLRPLMRLTELEYVYFRNVAFHEVLEFLQLHPTCLVDFTDSEYVVRFEARISLGRALRYFAVPEGDRLDIFIYPLEEDEVFAQLSAAGQQEFLRSAAPIIEELRAEYEFDDNCSFLYKEYPVCEGYRQQFRFQRVLLPAFKEDLLEAIRKLEELFPEEVDRSRAEWWLLKYRDLNKQILRQVPSTLLPPAEASPFIYKLCLETSFLDAYRKLDNSLLLWRWRPECEALLQQLGPLEGVEFYRQYNSLGRNLNCELLYPLWEIDRCGDGQLLLCLESLGLELSLPNSEFEAALQLHLKTKVMGV